MQIIIDMVIVSHLIAGCIEQTVIWMINDNSEGQLVNCLKEYGRYNLE